MKELNCEVFSPKGRETLFFIGFLKGVFMGSAPSRY
jgi:hypothetical protein